MLGILVVDKPLGATSHDVVGMLRRRLSTRRIGHAGTLDPLATGVLVVAVGPATRFLQYLPLEPKVYVARVKFGIETASYDAEGEIVAERPVPPDLYAKVLEALPSFLGLQEQIPPMFSAVKVKGRPLYDYARKGQVAERRPRTIHIGRLEPKDLGSDATENAEIELEIECSGGTYIRTLAQDLGQRLGCGAHLSGLRRTGVGRFGLDDAVAIDEVTTESLLPLEKALAHLPTLRATPEEAARVQNGVAIALPEALQGSAGETTRILLLGPDGRVLGIAHAGGNVAQPECVIPPEAQL